MDAVAIPATFLLMGEVPVGFEFHNDPLASSLGDPDARSDITESDVGCFSDENEHPGVIREKRPCARVLAGQCSPPLIVMAEAGCIIGVTGVAIMLPG
jgi:hypothetical protein